MELRRQILSVVVGANALLAACASTAPADGSSLGPGVDEKRMAQVQAAARRAGVEVHWINYPRTPTQ